MIREFEVIICGSEPMTHGFELVVCGFQLVTRGFQLVTRGFQLVTRGFQLLTHGFQLLTPWFELALLNFNPFFLSFQPVTCNSCFTISQHTHSNRLSFLMSLICLMTLIFLVRLTLLINFIMEIIAYQNHYKLFSSFKKSNYIIYDVWFFYHWRVSWFSINLKSSNFLC